MVWSRHASRAALALLAALAVGGCAWIIDPAIEHNGPQVAVVGNSITWMSRDEISAALEPNHAMVANAVAGAPITEMLPWLEAHLADSPIVVVNLGTADILKGVDWRPGLTRLLGDVAKTACVELATVSVAADPPGTTEAEQFNATLKAAAATAANLHVVDWAAATAAYPVVTQADHVHPSRLGSQLLADLYAAAIANDCAAATFIVMP